MGYLAWWQGVKPGTFSPSKKDLLIKTTWNRSPYPCHLIQTPQLEQHYLNTPWSELICSVQSLQLPLFHLVLFGQSSHRHCCVEVSLPPQQLHLMCLFAYLYLLSLVSHHQSPRSSERPSTFLNHGIHHHTLLSSYRGLTAKW